MTLTELYEESHRRFRYEDGELYHKENSGNQKKGDIAGSIMDTGYWRVWIGKHYLAHRIIFLMHHKYLPKLIDHVDRNPLNNRIGNLIASSKRLNNFNTGLSSVNKSGYRGVYWYKKNRKWHAQAKVMGKRHHLGYFDCPREASVVYEDFVLRTNLKIKLKEIPIN